MQPLQGWENFGGRFSPGVRCATPGFDISPLRGEEIARVEGAGFSPKDGHF
jgi:hypothetical protein